MGRGFRTQVIFLSEAALQADGLAVAEESRCAPGLTGPPRLSRLQPRQSRITISIEKGSGAPGPTQRRAGTSLNLCPLLSHSPPHLGVSFARSLPPS